MDRQELKRRIRNGDPTKPQAIRPQDRDLDPNPVRVVVEKSSEGPSEPASMSMTEQ